jgi:hypothetical protein
MSLQLSAPLPLAATNLLDDFACGEASLDEWLNRRALTNQLSAASRTFVVTDQHGRVYGYYAMAAGAISHHTATSAVRRNMPDPLPMIVLGRLAVDQRAQGLKLGGAVEGRGESGGDGFAKRRRSCPSGTRTARPCQGVLRALRLSGVAAPSDDADATAEYPEAMTPECCEIGTQSLASAANRVVMGTCATEKNTEEIPTGNGRDSGYWWRMVAREQTDSPSP